MINGEKKKGENEGEKGEIKALFSSNKSQKFNYQDDSILTILAFFLLFTFNR